MSAATRSTPRSSISRSVGSRPPFSLGSALTRISVSVRGEMASARYASHGLNAYEMLPRARFFATVRAVEDLAYGIEHDSQPYRDNALRALAQLL